MFRNFFNKLEIFEGIVSIFDCLLKKRCKCTWFLIKRRITNLSKQRVCYIACLKWSRANVPCVITWLRANVSCKLIYSLVKLPWVHMYSRANVSWALTCQRANVLYVLINNQIKFSMIFFPQTFGTFSLSFSYKIKLYMKKAQQAVTWVELWEWFWFVQSLSSGRCIITGRS